MALAKICNLNIAFPFGRIKYITLYKVNFISALIPNDFDKIFNENI